MYFFKITFVFYTFLFFATIISLDSKNLNFSELTINNFYPQNDLPIVSDGNTFLKNNFSEIEKLPVVERQKRQARRPNRRNPRKPQQRRKLQRVRLEQERRQRQRIANEHRLRQQRLQMERKRREMQRLRQQNLRRERNEKRRLEIQRLDRERLERYRLEDERRERERRERIEALRRKTTVKLPEEPMYYDENDTNDNAYGDLGEYNDEDYNLDDMDYNYEDGNLDE